jgi:hypothetical protein
MASQRRLSAKMTAKGVTRPPSEKCTVSASAHREAGGSSTLQGCANFKCRKLPLGLQRCSTRSWRSRSRAGSPTAPMLTNPDARSEMRFRKERSNLPASSGGVSSPRRMLPGRAMAAPGSPARGDDRRGSKATESSRRCGTGLGQAIKPVHRVGAPQSNQITTSSVASARGTRQPTRRRRRKPRLIKRHLPRESPSLNPILDVVEQGCRRSTNRSRLRKT